MSGGKGRSSGRRRWIHRRGVIYQATLRPPSRRPALGSSGHDRRAVVRISSTFGWPPLLPDWVGMAIRIFDVGKHDDEEHVDLLLASSVAEPQLRPNRDVLACTFSSAVRYRLGGVDQVVVAVPMEQRSATLKELTAGHADAACPIRYRLDAAETRRSWQGLGELVLSERLEGDDVALRFVPPNRGRGLVTPVRRLIYGWAQR
jgi:hypothetical protein